MSSARSARTFAQFVLKDTFCLNPNAILARVCFARVVSRGPVTENVHRAETEFPIPMRTTRVTAWQLSLRIVLLSMNLKVLQPLLPVIRHISWLLKGLKTLVWK